MPEKREEVKAFWHMAACLWSEATRDRDDARIVIIAPSKDAFADFVGPLPRRVQVVSADKPVRRTLSVAAVAFMAGGTCIDEALAFQCRTFALTCPSGYEVEQRRLIQRGRPVGLVNVNEHHWSALSAKVRKALQELPRRLTLADVDSTPAQRLFELALNLSRTAGVR